MLIKRFGGNELLRIELPVDESAVTLLVQLPDEDYTISKRAKSNANSRRHRRDGISASCKPKECP